MTPSPHCCPLSRAAKVLGLQLRRQGFSVKTGDTSASAIETSRVNPPEHT
ncbi:MULTISPECIES: hypothetical protein [unclassified Streptomyces]|nr:MULTISPECIES: hypothetical protein [unclassified Streptomyces]